LLRVSTEYRLGDRMEETIGDERPLGDAIAWLSGLPEGSTLDPVKKCRRGFLIEVRFPPAINRLLLGRLWNKHMIVYSASCHISWNYSIFYILFYSYSWLLTDMLWPILSLPSILDEIVQTRYQPSQHIAKASNTYWSFEIVKWQRSH
jgi:hypothetical protein